VKEGPCLSIEPGPDSIAVVTPGKKRFASVYPALGSEIRSVLALSLGAKASAEGRCRQPPAGRYRASAIPHDMIISEARNALKGDTIDRR
jgi:hypothetical protein